MNVVCWGHWSGRKCKEFVEDGMAGERCRGAYVALQVLVATTTGILSDQVWGVVIHNLAFPEPLSCASALMEMISTLPHWHMGGHATLLSCSDIGNCAILWTVFQITSILPIVGERENQWRILLRFFVVMVYFENSLFIGHWKEKDFIIKYLE